MVDAPEPGFTGFQLIERREQLEAACALVLGRMQFEFSRLDMAAGLCAVWIDDGRDLEAHTPRVEAMSLHKKLEFIEAAVDRRVKKGTPSYKGYRAWLERAHAARVQRNEFVHGRWGIDAVRLHAVNVLGLPTSPTQHEKRYSLGDLEAALEELKALQQVLYKLREQKPL